MHANICTESVAYEMGPCILRDNKSLIWVTITIYKKKNKITIYQTWPLWHPYKEMVAWETSKFVLYFLQYDIMDTMAFFFFFKMS